MGMQIRVYDRTLAFLNNLPSRMGTTTQQEHNNVGSLSFQYPANGVNVALLDLPVAYLSLTEDGNERPDWYILDDDGDDPGAEGGDARAISVACRGTLAVLDQAVVWPTDLTILSALTRTFSGYTPGRIMRTLVVEAQARGALVGVTMSFTDTTDSNGQPWPTTLSPIYDCGKDLLSIVTSLADDGYLDVRMRKLTLALYVPDAYCGTDRPNVVLRPGQSVQSGPRKRSRRTVKSAILGTGGQLAKATTSDVGAVGTFGRREGLYSAGQVGNPLTLSYLAGNTLTSLKDMTEGFTVGYVPDASNRPGLTYNVGDFIRYQPRRITFNQLEPLRVRSLSHSWADGGENPLVSVELNDLFIESKIRIARAMDRVLNGGVGPTTVAPVPQRDVTPPKAPTNITATTSAFMVGTANKVATTFSWDPPTQDATGNPLSDLSGFVSYWRFQSEGDAAYRLFSNAPDNFATLTFNPGDAIRYVVKAYDRDQNYSPLSTPYLFTVPTNSTPPPKPSVPVVVTRLGQVSVTWDGKDSAGLAMPLDLDRVEVHYSTTNAAFEPSAATYVATIEAPGGGAVIASQAYGAAVTVRLVAWDTDGNRSPASEPVTVTVTSVTSTDLSGKFVGAANIIDGAVGSLAIADFSIGPQEIAVGAVTTEKLTVGSIGDSVVVNPDFEDVASGDPTRPARWSVTSPARAVIDNAPGTVLTGLRSMRLSVTAGGPDDGDIQSDWFDVTGLEMWYVKCLARDTMDAYHGFYIGLEGGATQLNTSVVWAVINGVVGTTPRVMGGQVTIPDGWRQARLRIRCRFADSEGAHSISVDSTAARRVILSAAIADGAILADKIGANAVIAGKIAANAVTADAIAAGSVDTVKLAAKAITTDKLSIGVISVNPLPDPSFEEPYDVNGRGVNGWQNTEQAGTATLSKVVAAARSGQWSAKYIGGGVNARTNYVVNPKWQNPTGSLVTRTNLCPNPSFETSVNGYFTSLSATATFNRYTNFATSGAWAGRAATAAAASTAAVYFEVPALPGTRYTLSADHRTSVALTGWAIAIQAFNGATLLNTYQAAITVSAGWERRSITSPALPAGTTKIRCLPVLTTTGANGDIVYFDSVLCEQAEADLGYFDGGSGTSPDGFTRSWAGVAGESASYEFGASWSTAPFTAFGTSTVWSGMTSYSTLEATCLLQVKAAIPDNTLFMWTNQTYCQTQAAVPGETWSARVKIAGVNITGAAPSVLVRLVAYGATNNVLGTVAESVATLIPKNGPVNVAAPNTAATPAGTVTVRWTVSTSGGPIGAGSRMTFRDALMEKTLLPAGYFDGSNPFDTRYTDWAGSPNASASFIAGSLARLASGVFPVIPGASYRATMNLACPVASPKVGWSLAIITGGDPGSVVVRNALDASVTRVGTIAGGTNPPRNKDYQTFSSDYAVPAGATYARLEVTFEGVGSMFLDDLAFIRQGQGGASEMTAAGLRLFSDDGDEIGAFVSNRPNYFSVSAGNKTIASIDEAGAASFTSVTSESELFVAGKPLLGRMRTEQSRLYVSDDPLRDEAADPVSWLEYLPRGVIAWGAVSPVSLPALTGGAAEIGLIELDLETIASRSYVLMAPTLQVGVSAVGTIAMRARYTTNGTRPLVNSAILDQYVLKVAAVGSNSLMLHSRIFNGVDTGQDFRVLITMYTDGPAVDPNGPNNWYPQMWDIGKAKIPTGILSTGGGSPGSAVTPPPPPPTPPPKKTYVSTWNSIDSGTYRGTAGAPRRTDTSSVYQGYYSSNNMDQRGVWIFPDMTGTLAGSTVTKVECYLYANHWYYNGGGTARIGVHGHTGAPGANPGISRVSDSGGWPLPAGRWCTLPGNINDGFRTGAYRGIGVGPAGTTDLTYYGSFNGGANSAQIRITYVR